MGVTLYTGIGETSWNRYPVTTGGFACISPVKGRTIKTLSENVVPKTWQPHERIIQDSGAFQDSWGMRLSFADALQRQIDHAAKYNYARHIEYRVSYDLLIDEVWQDGVRHKRRWSVEQAQQAVETTVAAAQYLVANRNDLNLILSVQGVDARQYLACAKPVIDLMDVARDALGLGGWCIIGLQPAQMLPVFAETLLAVIPYAASKGVKRVHIFGVIFPKALGQLLWICDQYGIQVSTDSTSPANYPFRAQWGYARYRENGYQMAPVSVRGEARARHVRQTREYLKWLAIEPEYQKPFILPKQLPLFAV